MNSVFVVQHSRLTAHGEDNVKFIGVYRTRDSAIAAVRRLSVAPGFLELPDLVDPLDSDADDDQGFFIDEYELDRDHWPEGFVGSDDQGDPKRT